MSSNVEVVGGIRRASAAMRANPAWAVVSRDGERLDEGCLACDQAQCVGTDESRKWIGENVPLLGQTSPTKQHLHDELPAHYPLMDARQSARQVVACTKGRNV